MAVKLSHDYNRFIGRSFPLLAKGCMTDRIIDLEHEMKNSCQYGAFFLTPLINKVFYLVFGQSSAQ